MENEQNYFKNLASINVWEKTGKKKDLDYLPWSQALILLKEQHPGATWEVIKTDGLPYIKTPLGYFVEVSVTVDGITNTEILPVTDGANNTITHDCANPVSLRKTPILKHNGEPFMGVLAYDINTAIKRAFVKAVATHGLGIDVYTQENKPVEMETSSKKKATMGASKAKIESIENFYLLLPGVKELIYKRLEGKRIASLSELTELEATRWLDELETKYKSACDRNRK